MARIIPKTGLMAPDPEMWQALGKGKLLREIINDFYQHAYQDEQLAAFFKGVTIDRAAGKQYSFMSSMFTGKRVYFGDWPRTAHHWMVISNELFDHREALLEASMQRFDLADKYIKKWRAIDEIYRKVIVKDEPIAKYAHGVEFPLQGYKETTLDVSSVCDKCTNEINAGENVRYHVLSGEMLCPACSAKLPESEHFKPAAHA